MRLITLTFVLATASASSIVQLQKRDDSSCWLSTRGRGIGKPISACADGHERNGLLCYPLCPKNYTGAGPVCWNGWKPYPRGWGKPLGCGNGTEYEAGLCYKKCPPNFAGSGPVCYEQCPEDRPHKCGLICTVDKHQCTEEIISMSISGFSVLYGIGSFGAAIAATVGTAGIASVLAAFGFISGIGEFTTGSLSLAATLVSYPFCTTPEDKQATIEVLDDAKAEYQRNLISTCRVVNGDPAVVQTFKNAFIQ